MTLFCDYCNRVCDDRCDLCRYRDEATPIEPLDEEDNEDEKTKPLNS